jgi:SAM-dependent methyltransferase
MAGFFGTVLQRAAAACGFWVQRTGRQRNRFKDLPSWSYQEPVVMPRVKPGDIVLDIGSGNNPSPRADLLADFFPDDSFHRSGEVAEHKPLIICSVDRIPLRARSVDFVICSHVLEHIPDPARAAAELSRVAKAGYAETPAYGKDILTGTGYMHRWQVVSHEGTMHFFEYTPRQQEAFVASPVMKIWLSPQFHPWQEYFWKRQDMFNAWILWEGTLPVRVHRRSRAGRSAAWKPVDDSRLAGGSPALTEQEITLLERCLTAPDGTGHMRFQGDRFSDRSGRIRYPVRGKRIYCELGSDPTTPNV